MLSYTSIKSLVTYSVFITAGWFVSKVAASMITQESFSYGMDEICSNGVDDDGNGLTDAFDPACSCGEFSNENLVPNGDFESSSGCCFTLDSKNICLDDWHLMVISPDYHQVDCSHSDLALLDEAGIEYDGSLIGFGQITQTRTESIGACLNSPLTSGDTYKLGISLAALENIAFELDQDIDIIVYGLTSCQDMIDYDISTPFCDSNLSNEVVELFRVNMNSFPNNVMQAFEHEFVAPADVEAIMIHSDCHTQLASNIIAYFYMDNVEIFPVTSTFTFDSTIRSIGNLCTSDMIEIEVDQQAGVSYQWYRDSIPVPNEKQHNLTINSNRDLNSKFHVLVSSMEGCKLVGPYIPESFYDYFLEESICTGGEFILGDTSITTPGTYIRSVGITTLGCDSIVHLDLDIKPVVEGEFVIVPSLNVDVGQEISITATEGFIDKLQSYYWQVNSSGEQSSDPNFMSTSTGPLSLTLTFHYVDDQGCESSAPFNLEWTAPDGNVEICDNSIDDNGDDLIDVYDPDCNCQLSSILTEVSMIGNVCTDEILIEVPPSEDNSFQWYIDSTKIESEINNSLTIDKTLSKSNFHVAVYTPTGCTLVGPIEVRQGNLSQIYRDTFCEGYEYDFLGRTITEPGTYEHVSEDEYGCLKNVVVELAEKPSSQSTLAATICAGGEYDFAGKSLSMAGRYQDTLRGVSSIGCDSIVILDLSVDEVLMVDIRDTICSGQAYTFADQSLTVAGVYQDTVLSVLGCDSITVLSLEIIEQEQDTIALTVNPGETYLYDGISYSAGTYIIQEPSVESKCDKIIELIITEDSDLNIYVPNIFQPNSNTSANSGFFIFSDREVTIEEMMIYDRWGNEVYHKNNFTITNEEGPGWDGTFDGQLAAQGVYLYRIVLANDQLGEATYKGEFLLAH